MNKPDHENLSKIIRTWVNPSVQNLVRLQKAQLIRRWGLF